MDTPALSFVIPLKNEQATLRDLLMQIQSAVSQPDVDRTFELIFVDDGSDDDSWSVIRSLAEEWNGVVRAIRFRRNLGKAAALAAGFHAANGDVVFTLDADLQDDPREIPRFLAKLDEGFDIVTGWKKTRHDPWHKVLPSRVFNAMLSRATNTYLHDHNCGFKCYRSKVVKEVVLYGEMHRMVPALGSIRGFSSAEIEVTHHPRRFGTSKYGFERFIRGFMDMLTVAFLQKYRERPLHLMGAAAMWVGMLGAMAVAAGLVLFTTPHLATVLVSVGACLVASALPLFAIGFLAELVINTLARSRAAPPIEEVLGEPGNALTSLFESLAPSSGERQSREPRIVIPSTPPRSVNGDEVEPFLLAGNGSSR
jgi:dolichol-phosphate mannosyltransferase